MPRTDANRFAEMQVFVRVVELGGFSVAARTCRMTPSAVSKLVSRLERRLGAPLVNRSTRQLQLTAEGCTFYEKSVVLLADLAAAEQAVAQAERPSGRLRVNANVPFARRCLLPLVPVFLARYPEITLDLVLTDTVIDLLEERTDVAIRAGPMRSSGLVARKLGETRSVIVAAPAYLAGQGMPMVPADLERHRRLGFGYARAQPDWPLVEDGRQIRVPPSGPVQVSDGEAMRELALAGAGLARLTAFMVRDDVAAGRLVPVLEDFNPGDIEEFYAVFVGPRGQMPARVRALLEFLVASVRIEPRL